MSLISQIKLQILSKQTLELKSTEIKEICNLKNTHWNYGIKSNLIWFTMYLINLQYFLDIFFSYS